MGGTERISPASYHVLLHSGGLCSRTVVGWSVESNNAMSELRGLSVHCKHKKLREPANYVGCLCMYNMGLMPRNDGRN